MRTGVLKLLYLLGVTGLILVVLEGAARWIGFGDPILYYNAAWGGIRPLPNQQVRRLQGDTVTVDANGFRTAHPATPGALRLLYLGDSVTWGGSRVDDHDLFSEVAAAILRQSGRPVYAMNTGVNGTALVNQAERFDLYADSTDVLIWLFPWGDTERVYATVGALWPARFKPRFALVEAIDQVLFNYWLGLFREQPPPRDAFTVPHLPPGYEAMEPALLQACIDKNLAAARRVLAAARQRNLPVVLGITPFFDGQHLVPLPPAALDFLHTVQQQQVPVLAVSAVLEQAEAPLPTLFVDNSHLTAAGHQVVGQALGALLQDLLAKETMPTTAQL